MNWLTFAIGAILINTTLVLGLRVVSKGSANPRITGFIYNCYGALASIIIWVLSGSPLPANVPATAIFLLLLSALGYGIFQRGQFYLRKHVEASELVPVMQSGLIFGFLASIIILGETLTPQKLLGVGIIFAAALIVSVSKKLSVHKYTFFAIAISAALSIAGVIDKLASPHYPLFFYTMLIWIIPLPFIAFPVSKKEVVAAIKQTTWPIPLLAGLNALSLVFIVRALQLGEASKVIPIMGMVPVLSVLGGIVILGEKQNWQRKVLAGILATIGILILR